MDYKERRLLKRELEKLNHSTLGDICEVLHEDPSFQKPTMIKRIIDSNYEYSEIIKVIHQLKFVSICGELIDKKYLEIDLSERELQISGNKRELFNRLIENDVLDIEKLLYKIPVVTFNKIYERIFKRVPRKERNEAINEILKYFKLPFTKFIKQKTKIYDFPTEDFCFVLMPFTPELTEIYKSFIKPTVEKMGLKCKRADDFFTANKIMDDIESAIQKAKIVIADLTGRNPNVFYEVGLSHAWEKKVILISQSKNDIPFDLQHWRYLIYSNNDKGLMIFSIRLEKTINTIINEIEK